MPAACGGINENFENNFTTASGRTDAAQLSLHLKVFEEHQKAKNTFFDETGKTFSLYYSY